VDRAGAAISLPDREIAKVGSPLDGAMSTSWMTTAPVVCAIRHVGMFARLCERRKHLCFSGFGYRKAQTACEKPPTNARNQIRVERQPILAIENGNLNAAERKFDFENAAGYFEQRKIDFAERNFDSRNGSMAIPSGSAFAPGYARYPLPSLESLHLRGRGSLVGGLSVGRRPDV
jgi:hypothetical protein